MTAALTILHTLAQTSALPAEVATAVDVIESGGVIAVLVFAISAWLRGWVISGRQHDLEIRRMQEEMANVRASRDKREAEMREDMTYWRDTALRALKVGEAVAHSGR